jgi:DNA-binding GntR family transcriptional regulator
MNEVQSPILADLQPPDRRALHQLVLAQLLDGIRNGQLKPGERLLEVEIAERLNLSRGTTREAIRRLQQDGLVVTQPHRGTFVAQFGPRDVAELFSLRLLLETYNVRLAIGRLTEAALAELTVSAAAIVAAAERGDQIDQLRQDQRFHEQICLMSGHAHLYETWSRLSLKLWLVAYALPPRDGGHARRRARSHDDLIDMLRRGAADAASAWLAAHIRRRAHEVLTVIAGADAAAELMPLIDAAHDSVVATAPAAGHATGSPRRDGEGPREEGAVTGEH